MSCRTILINLSEWGLLEYADFSTVLFIYCIQLNIIVVMINMINVDYNSNQKLTGVIFII